MAKRKRVGLLFSYNENWIGGTYYLLNIIKAVNTLKDDKKPVFVIITNGKDNFDIVQKETNYPYLKLLIFPIKKLVKYKRGINKISQLFSVTIFNEEFKKAPVDFLYPDYTKKLNWEGVKKVSWIPDFQDRFLPSYFSNEELEIRKKWQTNISENNDVVIFSSENAKNHFSKLYKDSVVKKYILHFAVSLPDFSKLNKDKVLNKYSLPKKYFFAPNQFWAHKNHITILEAVKLLKDRGVEVYIAFSGKDHDYRNKDYVETLKEYIQVNNLTSNISFLGFLDRKEQLLILQNSIAIVQPSLFEGWSTVVEDSKALNKFIILSDLPVHKEQIQINCEFFERENENNLSELLEKYYQTPPIIEKKMNYQLNINNFGDNFMDLVNLVET